jgi:phosphoenolpyruvate synthase/pyruvate phosphate dikinase
MDIFAEESEETESSAGHFAEFLEELTMDQVSEEADRLLEEFRAI